MTKPAYKPPEGLKLPKGETEEWKRRVREDDGRLTPHSISRELREITAVHYRAMQPYRFLTFMACNYPVEYLAHVEKCLVRHDEAPLAGIQIVVQQLVTDATPTPGVLNSPIQAHVQPKPAELALVERVEVDTE